jgi:hypothetical protein
MSELVELPEFLPGLGQLFVDHATLPAGPFLRYDHDGRLSATIYMTPVEDREASTAYKDLAFPFDGAQCAGMADGVVNGLKAEGRL